MHRKSGTILAFLLVAVSCGEQPAPKAAAPPTPPLPAWVIAGEPAPYLVEILGEKKLAIMRNADRIESFRIECKKRPAAPNTINGFPLISKGPDLDTKQSAQARRIVTRFESTFPLGAKLCGDIHPGVALRFHRGDQYVTALICFNCTEWYFEFNDELDDGFPRGKLNFEGTHADLLQLVKGLFPQDDTINRILPLDQYTVAYQVLVPLPSNKDDIRADYAKGSAVTTAKYLPEAAMKVKNWDQGGGYENCALAMDGLLFIHTTAENHAIISEVPGVRAVEQKKSPPHRNVGADLNAK